ncbi:MAG: hemerythrin family protein [Epsilonproteobacteria bacterium]|nr:hemerythrin family protein [Campylobacterota bacterium]
MALIWRRGMSVGNETIDHDHRYLVCYLNTVELALQKPENEEVLLTSLSQLYNYAYEHFIREESIQKKIKYPNIKEHRKEHQQLLEELLDLKNKIKNEYDNEHISKNYDEIVKFLRHWLIDHVLNTDMAMKKYLEKYPKNFPNQ